jgi:uncharacterized delta-60 repeat protein
LLKEVFNFINAALELIASSGDQRRREKDEIEMTTRVLLSGVAALSLGAALLLACGDDDAVEPTPTPDSGPALGTDAAQPVADAAQTDAPAEAATDALAPAAPIVPLTTTRMANAINPYGLVFASDGFLYASGATIDGAADRVLAVWRFKDGVLDTTFGTGGVVTVGITGAETSYDIVEVSAGNFVVHAVTSGTAGKVYLAKLTKDVGGAYSFGTPVEVAFDWADGDFTDWPGASPPVYATSWGIALDKTNAASPKIVVFASGAPAKGKLGKAGGAQAGVQRTDNDRWIARVLADTLAPDPAFNGGKAFSADIDNLELPDNARRGLVQADGSIVAAGYTATVGGNSVALLRLLANGSVDPTFGFGTTAPGVPGQAKFNAFSAVTGGFSEAYAIGRQSSGRYVTGGYGTTNFAAPTVNPDFLSFGVKADGLDPTFGKLGALVWQSEGDKSAGLGTLPFSDRTRSLVVLPDDRIAYAGQYDDYASIFVADKNGKADPSAGVNGRIEYSYPAGFFRVAASPDGTRLAASAQSLNQNADAGAPLGSVLAILKVGQ